jgi:hypothetical protein
MSLLFHPRATPSPASSADRNPPPTGLAPTVALRPISPHQSPGKFGLELLFQCGYGHGAHPRRIIPEKHLSGQKIEAPRGREPSKVVNLMEALRRSAETERGGKRRKPSTAQRGLEGIVSKRLGSRYRAGRSPDWLKFKNPEAPAVQREAEEDWSR